MIVVTGAAGFIASALVSKLNSEGFNNIVLVDDFSFEEKNLNLEGRIMWIELKESLFRLA